LASIIIEPLKGPIDTNSQLKELLDDFSDIGSYEDRLTGGKSADLRYFLVKGMYLCPVQESGGYTRLIEKLYSCINGV